MAVTGLKLFSSVKSILQHNDPVVTSDVIGECSRFNNYILRTINNIFSYYVDFSKCWLYCERI